MDLFTKWTLTTLAVLISISPSYAWNIASVGRVTGPSIHSTYFLTPNNASFPIHAHAYVGQFTNGTCQYGAAYNLGTESIKTGDVIDIDAFKLKSLIGLEHTCMVIFYTGRQVVTETIMLTTDGINYTNSVPSTAEVSVL